MARQPLKPLNLLEKQPTIRAGQPTKENIFGISSPQSGTDSPSVCSLSGDFKELSTRRRTPRRRLSLENVDTPKQSDRQNAVDKPSSFFATSMVFADSPTPIFSPTENSSRVRPSTETYPIFRRMHSSPPLYQSSSKPSDSWAGSEDSSQGVLDPETMASSLLGLDDGSNDSVSNPCLTGEDGESQDSGLGFEKSFKMPVVVGSRGKWRFSEICEDACSPLRYSPARSSSKRALSFSPLLQKDNNTDGKTPVRLKRSNSIVGDAADDDGFLDMFSVEEPERESDSPKLQGLASLLHGPVLHSTSQTHSPQPSQFPADDSTPVSWRQNPNSKRSLLRSQSLDVKGGQFKRADPPQVLAGPSKRHRDQRGQPSGASAAGKSPGRCLHRSHSASEAQIKMAVHKLTEDRNLIADSSKPHVLPTMAGKHQDLQTISAETLKKLIQGEYSDQVEDFHIVDCRYPYEYDGGHIVGAVNIHTRQALHRRYLETPVKSQDPNKRFLVVFHCEFSSERGPNLYRYLREQDRKSNLACYPSLHYPEVYVLQGGYCEFFKKYKELCEPQSYIEMVHRDYSKDLLKFREKSKSWAGEKGNNRLAFRSLKY